MWSDIRHRLVALARRRRFERELDEEIEFHQAMAAERGSSRRFGNELRVREAARDQWMIAWLESLAEDMRYAARSLRRAPAFTLGIITTLALGIGANAAIFSLAYGVLWHPLPYPEAGRIVEIRQAKGPEHFMMDSSLDVTQARQRPTGLEDWVMYQGDQAALTGAGGADFLSGAIVESGLWRLLGVKPIAGRLTEPSDDRPGSPAVMDISERLWRSRFGSRDDIVGRTVLLDGQPVQVAGVLPRWFQFPGSYVLPGMGPDYWRSWQQSPEDAGNRDVAALARLGPGATLRSVGQRLQAAMQALASEHAQDQGWRFQVTPMLQAMVGDTALALELMLAVVAAVLLIAAINIAGLLLARTQLRERELATRAALGASRRRLARQLAVEAGLLMLGGLMAGLGVGAAGVASLRAYAPQDTPRLAGLTMSWPAVGFAAAVALLAGMLFGLAPALGASRQAQLSLRLAGRGAPGALTGGRRRGRAALVVAQVALAAVLCVGAGLLLRSFARLAAVPMGFNPRQVLGFGLSLPPAPYETGNARHLFFGHVQTALATLPGARAVALATFPPLQGEAKTGYALPGRPLKPNDDSQITGYNEVSPGYFQLLQIPQLSGRGILASDTAATTPVTVISASMARQVFPGKNPIGQRIRYSFGQQPWRTVVGVVGDVRSSVPGQPSPPDATAYVPLAQGWAPPGIAVLVRTPGPAPALVAPARRAIALLDAQMPLIEPMPLDQMYQTALDAPRFRSAVVAGFAGLALLLSAVGLFGLLSYMVAARAHEFGIRSALGARAGQVRGLVLRQALALAAAGAGIGLATSWPLTGYLKQLLFGVAPLDPAVLAASAALLLAAATVAAWLPARRAMRADPVQALRCE